MSMQESLSEQFQELAVSSDETLVTAKKITNMIVKFLGDSVYKVILFGSRARGDNRQDSDYDILILGNFNNLSWSERVSSLSSYIRAELKTCGEVDYIVLTECEYENKFLFRYSVFKEGLVLYVSDAVGAWLKKAKGDVKVASVSFEISEWDSVCYHSTQSAEKFLKSILEHVGIIVPRTHDLIVLHDLLVSTGIKAPALLRNRLDVLNGLDSLVRYPGYDATSSDAEKALFNAKEIFKFVEDYYGDSFNNLGNNMNSFN